MPKYNVVLNHVYEDTEEVEVEADNEWEALSIAEGYAVDINDAWDHAGHTSTQALQADLIEGEA